MTDQCFIFRYNTIASFDAPSGLSAYVTFSGATTEQASFTLKKPIGWNIVDVLIVAGGGCGGYGNGLEGGGGGGAGGMIYSKGYALGESTVVKVGNGGSIGVNGGNSVFDSFTAVGGGRGGRNADIDEGANGGSGGGSRAASFDRNGGQGTAGQGNNGGFAFWQSGGSGGGGAYTAGSSGGTAQTQNIGGQGGSGRPCSITGTLTYYAGGGGGGSVSSAGVKGLGGVGGGGNGGGDGSVNGTNGTAHTGGGGGGSISLSSASANPGVGGSGIVVVRFRNGASLSSLGTLSFTTIRTLTKGTSDTSRVKFSEIKNLTDIAQPKLTLSSLRNRGFQPTSGNKWVIGALDFVSTNNRPKIALSLRRLYIAYTGPQIRVRRSTDNLQANVYFNSVGQSITCMSVNNDTTYSQGSNALSNWLGAATAFAEVWFDQSGNNFHMTMQNGVILSNYNGNMYLGLDGTTQLGLCDGSHPGSTAANVVNLDVDGNKPKTTIIEAIVEEKGSLAAGLFDLGDFGVVGQHFCLRLNASYTKWRAQFWGTSDFDFDYDGRNNNIMYTTTHDGTNTRVYADIQLQGSKTNTLVTGGARTFEIGRYRGLEYFGGRIRSAFVFNRGLSQADVTTLYNSL